MSIPSPRGRDRLRTALLSVAVAAVFAGLGGLTGCGSSAADAAAPPPPEVGVVAAEVREVQQWDEVNGRVEAVQHVELRPRVSGYIDKVNYREGQLVAQGDVLFQIDDRSYRAALAEAEAALANARARAAVARSEAARAQKLVELNAVSTEQNEQRRAAAAQADAEVQAAQAAVDAARLDLEFTRVRAPIAGRAGRALVTAGNLVSAESGVVLTTLVSVDPIHVHFDTDEATFLRYAGLARAGERPSERDAAVPVQVGLVNEEGFPHAGVVDFLDNRVDPATGSIRARAVLDNSDGSLTPGLFARVRVLGRGASEALLIDDKAVLTDQDRKYVYVVDAEGRAQRRDVRLGRVVDGRRIVEDGLAAGDRVIVSGVQKVFFPGMPVQAVAAADADAPAVARAD
ncbi:efflux RND transporter periplasmic adaptor subunit [Coralloluteibacterium stylophorae]|uniref:Efflux RND transporter periplasmic adaptor subunit n=1 Tax=Coralloluteibacterium stylophorae TaxID=1776034 RepID=A0A8J7VR41_9GAMM|nr:efflux RND transporter periplasmic adaptor subunit [Coralloluteibacterium stylophorae]